MKHFRLQPGISIFYFYIPLTSITSYFLLLSTLKSKFIKSGKMWNLLWNWLHSEVNSNFSPVNNLFSHLRQVTELCLCFLYCKAEKITKTCLAASMKRVPDAFQAAGKMYKMNGSIFPSWQMGLRGKMKHPSNAFGKWHMLCPYVPNSNSGSPPAKTIAFISY